MTSENKISDLAVGDSVVFQRRFTVDRVGRVHKVTERYLYVELTNTDTGIPYVSCVKFRRTDGKAFSGRTPNVAYRLHGAGKAVA